MASKGEHSAPVWELYHVGFGYAPGSYVLESIDLKLISGRIYGILGPNGSGKTTLLDLLCGFLEPDHGKILFEGVPLQEIRARKLAKRVAMVPQEFVVRFPFTVLQVVEMGLHPHLPRFGSMSQRDEALIHGVMSELEVAQLASRPVTMLSGGEKQRVAAARALVQARKALLLDEATSNLDIYHSLSIIEVVRKRAGELGLCVVAAVHDINLATIFCDELIFLSKGRVLAQGRPDDVLDSALIRQVYGVDARVSHDEFTGRPAVSFRLRA